MTSKTKYITKEQKYFHLSNSGLEATIDISDPSDKETKYPHVKIQLKTGTFGIMNSVLELIACSHNDHFMNVSELLELSEFFAAAAKITNDMEIIRHYYNVKHWEEIIAITPPDKDFRLQKSNELKKNHFVFNKENETLEVKKRLEQKNSLDSIVNNIENTVSSFNKKYYQKPEYSYIDGSEIKNDDSRKKQKTKKVAKRAGDPIPKIELSFEEIEAVNKVISMLK